LRFLAAAARRRGLVPQHAAAASRSGQHECMLLGRASGSPSTDRAAPFQLLIAKNVPASKEKYSSKDILQKSHADIRNVIFLMLGFSLCRDKFEFVLVN
jgi:hypothetical protein